MQSRQKTINPCKVALYIRWSTEDQGEGTTLDVQMEGCRHYALSQGWTVSEALTFIDDGHSGGSLDRPALKRLREAVAREEVDCVVVYKLDRLSRDVPDMIRLIMEEWDGACFVKSAREPIDTTSQAGKMFFYTLASYAEWERSVIKERTFSGKLRRAQEGKNPGMRAPYGYSAAEAGFAVLEHEAEVVRRIFTMYRQGKGCSKIAITLNTEGVPFREGRLWNLDTVKYILRNTAYKGDLTYGVRTVDSRKRKRVRNLMPHVVREGAFPAIISPEEWDSVQEVRRKRPGPATGTSGRAHSSRNLLTGLLKCAGCGTHMRSSGASYGEVKYRYYVCSNIDRKGRLACDARRVRQDLLDTIVVDQLRELYGSKLARRAYVERTKRQMAAEEAAARGALVEVDAQQTKIEGKRKKLRAMVLEDALTTEEYRAFVQDVEEEARGLEARREALKQRLASVKVAQSEQVGLASTMARVDLWDALDKPEQKELLRTFVEQVQAYLPKGEDELSVNVTWRLPGGSEEQSSEVSVSYRSGETR